MSLSAEALAQLEGLDLQEAREGLNFASATEVGQSVGVDLSSEELAGLRSWDLSGVMARLNSLTFEPPSAPMPEPEPPAAPEPAPDETVAPISDSEGGLPDWLKPAEEAAPPAGAETPAEETAESAPLPEEQPAVPSGPTAEEAAAGLAAAEASPGTQVLRDGEVVIPPAVAETPAAVEAEAKKGLAKWLEKIDFGKLAREGIRYLIPPLTGLALGRLLPPEQAWNLTQTAFAVGMLGFIGSGGCAVAERVVSGQPRAAGIARLLAAGKVIGAVLAETGMLMSAGSFAGGLWHEREIVRQVAAQMGQPEVTGAGDIGSDYYHGVSDVNLPKTPVEQVGPPKLTPEQTDLINRIRHPELVEAQQREAAELAANQAAAATEAARQAALEAATRTHAIQSNETLSAIVSRYSGKPMGADMTNTILQSAGELTGGTDLAGSVRPGADEAMKLVEYLKVHPTVTWQEAVNNGLRTTEGELVAKLFADATRMIYPGKLLNVVVGAATP